MNQDCTKWFQLCLVLCGTLLSALAMFFGYSLKLSDRTASLEKKNGKEQKQINELKTEIKNLKEKNA